MIKKDLLFSIKVVIYPANGDRRSHDNCNTALRTDANIKDRDDNFSVRLNSKYVYRIPLKYFRDLRKIDFPTKIDLKIRCTLETEMKRLFKSTKKRLRP